MPWIFPAHVEVFQPPWSTCSRWSPVSLKFGHIFPEFRGYSPVSRAYWHIPFPGFSTRFIWSRLVATVAQSLLKLDRMVVLVQDCRCHALSGPHIMMRIPLMRHART